MSNIDANTSKKSNLFQFREKYDLPNPISLRTASAMKTEVKK